MSTRAQREELVGRIRVEADRRRWADIQLARHVRLNAKTIRRMWKGEASFDTLARVALVLGVPLDPPPNPDDAVTNREPTTLDQSPEEYDPRGVLAGRTL